MDTNGLGTLGDIMKQQMSEVFGEAPAELTPMNDTTRMWHHSRAEVDRQDVDPNKVGKWMIFVPVENVDSVWSRIKKATDSNSLGLSAKCATARPNSRAKDPNIKLICVYTYDYDDKEDVFHVRQKLTEMGFKQTLYYKADMQTANGKYGKGSWMYKG